MYLQFFYKFLQYTFYRIHFSFLRRRNLIYDGCLKIFFKGFYKYFKFVLKKPRKLCALKNIPSENFKLSRKIPQLSHCIKSQYFFFVEEYYTVPSFINFKTKMNKFEFNYFPHLWSQLVYDTVKLLRIMMIGYVYLWYCLQEVSFSNGIFRL